MWGSSTMIFLIGSVFILFLLISSIAQYKFGLIYSKTENNNILVAIFMPFLLTFMVSWSFIFLASSHGGGVPLPLPAPIATLYWMSLDKSWGGMVEPMIFHSLTATILPIFPYYFAYFGNRSNPAWSCLNCHLENKLNKEICEKCGQRVSDSGKVFNWLCPSCNTISTNENTCSVCNYTFGKA